MIRSRSIAAIAAGVFAVALLLGASLDAASASGGFHAASSYDDDIADAKKEEQATQDRIDKLQAELEDTDAAIVEAAARLQETEDKLPAAQQAVEEAQKAYADALVEQQLVADKLAAAEEQDRAISQQIADDEDRIQELKDIVASLARAAYQGVGDDQALGLVFGSSTSQEFVDKFAAEHNASRVQSNALADVEEIAAVNRNRGSRQEAVREYIVELKAEADRLVEETARLKAEAEEKKRQLDELVKEQKAIKAELEEQREAAIKKQKELAAKQEQVRSTIKDLVKKKLAEEEAKRKAAEEAARKAAEEAAAANKPSSGGSSGSGTTTGLAKGALGWPAASHYVTSSYGMRFHPILHYWRLHAGTDMRAYCGTPIYAARSGTVQWATWQPGLGNSVLIDHGYVGGKSLMSSYNHLSAFAVGSGQNVSKGQLVGYSGNTGTSAACHLHFEVYVNGDTVDPMTLVQ